MGWRGRWANVVRAADRHAADQAAAAAPRPSVGVVQFSAPTIDSVISAATESWQTGAVPRDVALQVPAVLRGRNLICSISTLPMITVDRVQKRIPSPLLDQIDPQTPNVVTLAMTIEDLLMDALAWWRVTVREPAATEGALGFPRYAEHVATSRVSLRPPPGADLRELPSGIDPDGVVWVDGKSVDGRDMIRFDSPNPALLKAARRAIRRAAMLEQAAERYARTPRALGYFSPAEGADPADDDDIAELLADWRDARNEEADGYVPAALKYNSISVMSPAELQLAELQKRAALDIANALGLDPEDLGISTTSRTYQNATDRRQDRINEVLTPYMLAITARLSMNDVTRRGQAVSFDLANFLKPDPITRTSYYKAMRDLGAMTPEEIRAAEGLPPLPAGAAAPAAQDDNTGGSAAGEENNVRPIRAVAFSAGNGLGDVRVAFAATTTLDGGEDLEQFRVSRETRTIKGAAIPYNVIASNGWARWKFLPGSLSWSDPGRVKFLLEHNPGRTLGVATELVDSKRQLKASFRVGAADHAETAFRDAALSDAADGILDGLSVGVSMDPEGVEWSDEEKCYVVSKATLREISLCSIPAFDDARLTRVAASSSGGTMDCPLCGREHAAGTPCAAPPTATQASAVIPAQPTGPAAAPAAVTLSLGADFAAQLAGALVAAQPEAPAFVSPRGGARGAALGVTEPLPYRFDGHRGPNEFSADLFATDTRRKGYDPAKASEAAQRIERFLQEVFVTSSDVNELNPNRNRPDLYVGPLAYSTPMWNAIDKGTIADSTPFVIPKFSSSSGLVGTHTEGTEPTAGTFVTTSQTITPGAISGKVVLTRETIDQGGNPAVSGLIWDEILRAWAEALEARAVAILEAETPTAIALTAGGTDEDLAGEFEGALAELQFIAGGFRMRDLFLHKALFTALVGATDGTGRKLYPLTGAMNANGSVAPDFGYLTIGGLQARPSWALATSASAEESSYLFSRSDVHGWASAPQRLQFEYEVAQIHLGVWGYAATAVTRAAGIREITYDPTA